MSSANALLDRWGWNGTALRKAFSMALAAWIAFAIASHLHLHNAYWAAMPVWVIAQPTRGIMLERSFFRLVGTVIGASFGLALIHLPLPPHVQILALALWIALHTGLTQVHRGVHGYGANLAGMTAAIVLVPSILAPADTLHLALGRVDCTLIGVIVGTLVMALFTPGPPLAQFYAQVRGLSADALAYAACAVKGGSDAKAGEHQVLALISQLESTARLTAAGSLEGYRRQRHVDLLVVASLSVMAAARDARDGYEPIDPALPEHLERIAGHLRRDWTAPLPPEERHLESGPNIAVQRLEAALGDILAADRALSLGTQENKEPRRRGTWLAPHREWGLALRAGSFAGILSLVALTLAFHAKVPALGLSALGVCLLSQVISALPLPQLAAPKMLLGVLLGAATALGYLFWIQPSLGGVTSVTLCLIPFLILGGLIRTHPRTAPLGLDFVMVFLMASQYGKPAPHSHLQVFQDTGALALGVCIVVSMVLLVPRNPRRQAQDAILAIRRDLQRMLEAGVDPQVWHARGSRQILRLALHIGRAGGGHPEGLMATLNLGRAIIDLHLLGMPEGIRALVERVLHKEISPQEGALALRRLAEPLTEERRPLVRRLADTLEQASGLLSFSLRPQA